MSGLADPLLVFLCAFPSDCKPVFLRGSKEALLNYSVDEGWAIVATMTPDLLFSSLKEVTSQPIMGFDPLPPLDSIVSYTRPERYFLALRCACGSSEALLGLASLSRSREAARGPQGRPSLFCQPFSHTSLLSFQGGSSSQRKHFIPLFSLPAAKLQLTGKVPF